MSDVPVSSGMMDRPIPANMQYCTRESVANWYPCIKSPLGGKQVNDRFGSVTRDTKRIHVAVHEKLSWSGASCHAPQTPLATRMNAGWTMNTAIRRYLDCYYRICIRNFPFDVPAERIDTRNCQIRMSRRSYGEWTLDRAWTRMDENGRLIEKQGEYVVMNWEEWLWNWYLSTLCG